MRNPRLARLGFILALLLIVAGCSDSDLTSPLSRGNTYTPLAIPPGYYDTVDPSTPATLRATVHAVVDDHTRFPYTSTATDTWDILDEADEDPGNASNVIDVYRNASYPKAGAGNSNYNREHTWPNSYGYPDDNASNYPYSDCHSLFICDDGYNSSRGNKPYRTCSASCLEKPTDANNGIGGGTGVYPGNSSWTSGSGTTGTWETWTERRGDVARALLYLDVRYEGGTHGGTGISEPDLILTDDEALIASSNTGSNESVAYMGMRAILLQWHIEDPVDDGERTRNDVIYSYQGNRNPFVDHPEWVDCVYSGNCGGGDVTPPAAPTNLVATAGDAVVDLDWDDNTEPDLDGYNVYRSTSAGGPYSIVNGSLLASSLYSDTGVTNGTTYYYVVTASDVTGNESGNSNEDSAMPQGSGGGPVVWINEFHYDNKGGDRNEFVEVAGVAGTDLSGWQVIGYNGSGGGVYGTQSLSGSIANQLGGFGVVDVAFSGLQNGSPDGIALVDDVGTVIQFLSYEGSFTATAGAASGMTSVDVGVAETSNDPKNRSLQLTGSGTQYADFTWQGPDTHTRGNPNTEQSFGGGGDTTPPADPTGLVATAGDGSVDLDWDDNTEPDLDGYLVHRATTAGGPYTQITASPVSASAYTDNGVTNGTTYYYVVTAVDVSGNESGNSNEDSATPQGSGGGGAMHVDSIVLSTVPAGGPNERGRAVVTVLDAQGAPVSGASVTGTFTGDLNETLVGVTDAAGVVTLTTNGKKKGPLALTFCVDGITKSGWTYDSASNVETCDSLGGAS